MIFVGFFIICLIAVLGVFWCLWGFSRELRRSRKAVGVVVVRVVGPESRHLLEENSRMEDAGRNVAKIAEFPLRPKEAKPGMPRRSGQAGRKVMSLAGLMILVGSSSKGGSNSKAVLADAQCEFENTRGLRVEVAAVIPEIHPVTTLVHGRAS